MASQGPLSAVSAVDDSTIGTIAWVNPTNALVDDATYATLTLNTEVGHYLKVTGFGFTVPSSANITGILVEIEAKYDITGYHIGNVVLSNSSGFVGSQKSMPIIAGTAEVYVSSSIDLWGTTWVASDINSSTFGVGISDTSNNGHVLYVDHVRITVYYTVTSMVGVQSLTGVSSIRL